MIITSCLEISDFQARKTTIKTEWNPFAFYLLWIVTTTIGWSAGILELGSDAKTYMGVVRLVPIYLADGLLIGFLVGIGQALVLRRFTHVNWAWATTLGYGLAFLTGLIVSVSLPSIFTLLRGAYPSKLPFREPSTVSIFINIDDLFWGGFLIASIQRPILKKLIPNPNRSKVILWILASWFALGMSFFIRAFTYETFLANFQMGIMGMVMGVVTGLILLTFLSDSAVIKQYATN
jgi:hypothetical protein